MRRIGQAVAKRLSAGFGERQARHDDIELVRHLLGGLVGTVFAQVDALGRRDDVQREQEGADDGDHNERDVHGSGTHARDKALAHGVDPPGNDGRGDAKQQRVGKAYLAQEVKGHVGVVPVLQVGVKHEATRELDDRYREDVCAVARKIRHEATLKALFERQEQRVQDKAHKHHGGTVHGIRVEPVAPQHRVFGMELTRGKAVLYEQAVAGLEPMAEYGEHDKIDDVVAPEGPALAVDHDLVDIGRARIACKVVDKFGLHAVRERKVEQQEQVKQDVEEDASKGRSRIERHKHQVGHNGEARYGHDHGSSKFVAVDEEVERHRVQHDEHPVKDRARRVGDRIARGEEQRHDRKDDLEQEADLDHTQETERVGIAKLDGVVRALGRLGRRLVVGMRLPARLPLAVAGSLGLFAVAHVARNDGKFGRLVGYLVGLDRDIGHLHGSFCVLAGLTRNDRAIHLAGGKRTVDRTLRTVDVHAPVGRLWVICCHGFSSAYMPRQNLATGVLHRTTCPYLTSFTRRWHAPLI